MRALRSSVSASLVSVALSIAHPLPAHHLTVTRHRLDFVGTDGDGRQQQQPAGETGITAVVTTMDGAAVSSGSALLEASGRRIVAPIDATGRFRVVPTAAGPHQLIVSAPGRAPFRVIIAVPPSRTVKLPPIRLSDASYFSVRFVSAAGEPIVPSRVRRNALDVHGTPIPEPFDAPPRDAVDSEGTVIVGPLPRGVITMAVDQPPFAITRLPDLVVTTDATMFEGRTQVIQPGAVLHVQVADRRGEPVRDHDVLLEDTVSYSPLPVRRTRTDANGRAVFDRLAAGRYRIATRVVGSCDRQPLFSVRVVSASGRGVIQTTLMAGGRASLIVSTPFGPLGGALVTATPQPSTPTPPAWLHQHGPSDPTVPRLGPPFMTTVSCSGRTDPEGRLTLDNFPPGAAQVEVSLPNSRYIRQVGLANDAAAAAIRLPDGVLPIRVVDALTRKAVARAEITWTSAGARVVATANASGEALLESVGAGEGTLSVIAPGYRAHDAKLREVLAEIQEVALVAAPASVVQARVVTPGGKPLADAVVDLSASDPLEISHVAVTDRTGTVTFDGVGVGARWLSVHAEGFPMTTVSVPEDARSGLVVTVPPPQ
jgi:hypothetical protein